MKLIRPRPYLEKMKHFTKHKEACSYAKANPGFVVIRYEDGWIVGKWVSKSDLKKKACLKEYRREEAEFESQLNAEIAEQEYIERIEMIEYGEVYYDNLEDPDDWNRSNKEGWFYADGNER